MADAIQLQKVGDIVLSDSDRKYVVVSAPGKRYSDDNKVTDLLYLCKTHVDHNIPVDHIFQVICDRFKIMEVNLSIVGLYGGDVGVASEVGVGTTFTVRFPMP